MAGDGCPLRLGTGWTDGIPRRIFSAHVVPRAGAPRELSACSVLDAVRPGSTVALAAILAGVRGRRRVLRRRAAAGMGSARGSGARPAALARQMCGVRVRGPRAGALPGVRAGDAYHHAGSERMSWRRVLVSA